MKNLRVVSLVSITMALLLCLGAQLSAQAPACSDQGAWTTITPQYSYMGRFNETIGVMTPLLLTDGRIMGQYFGSFGGLSQFNSWFTLTPDDTGSYTNPNLLWNQIASLPTGYGPSWFASAVLADGKVIVEGGENGMPGGETNLGALYDPVMNTWTPVNPPNGWNHIGDAPSAVLPNETFMMGQIFSLQSALFDEGSLTWTVLPSNGKADISAEEGWTLLPNGDVLTVDVNSQNTNSEVYNPTSQTWTSAGSTIVQLWGTENGTPNEIGPAVLMPNGTVLATGACVMNGNNCTAAHTALYSTATGEWSVGPNLPALTTNPLDMGDAPAALLPNGNVMMVVSPFPDSSGPAYVLEYQLGSNSFCKLSTGVPPTLAKTWANLDEMMMLPSGQILISSQDSVNDPNNYLYVFTPSGCPGGAGCPYPGSVPTLTANQFPNGINPGSTYRISGTLFNGVSQDSMFGDDFQNATNYPLVRITDSQGNVFYAKTHNHSSMGVGTAGQSYPTYTYFDVPSNVNTGNAQLVVVANGISSAPISVVVN
jgi:hypothetical protein